MHNTHVLRISNFNDINAIIFITMMHKLTTNATDNNILNKTVLLF